MGGEWVTGSKLCHKGRNQRSMRAKLTQEVTRPVGGSREEEVKCKVGMRVCVWVKVRRGMGISQP